MMETLNFSIIVEEVKTTIKSLAYNKAPDPDGYTGDIFQVIGETWKINNVK